MTYKIGTRVRKVRGLDDVWMTGVVIDVDPNCPLGHTLLILGDRPMHISHSMFDARSLGPQAWGHPDHWEPILDRHEPAEQDFQESLDHLLSRLKGVEDGQTV